ncbi:MAG: hypothetical protein ACPICB_06935, partial [Candidatus Poseidoniaceae archaeon]
TTTSTAAPTTSTATTNLSWCCRSSDGLATASTTATDATADAATNDAATTNDEYPTNNTFGYSLSWMRNWIGSKLAILSGLWKHEHECSSLIFIGHEYACLS